MSLWTGSDASSPSSDMTAAHIAGLLFRCDTIGSVLFYYELCLEG